MSVTHFAKKVLAWRLGKWKRIAEELRGISSPRSLVFLYLKLNELPSDARSDACLRLVSGADVRARTQYSDGWFSRDKALERLDKGCQLFALRQDGTDVCFEWLERGTLENHWMRLRLNLPAGVVYAGALYTVPQSRGQGLASRTIQGIIQHCKRAGDQRLLVAVEPHNTASLQLHRKLGFHEYQRIDYYRFLFAYYYRIRTADSRRCRRWFGFFRGRDDAWKMFWPRGDFFACQPSSKLNHL